MRTDLSQCSAISQVYLNSVKIDALEKKDLWYDFYALPSFTISNCVPLVPFLFLILIETVDCSAIPIPVQTKKGDRFPVCNWLQIVNRQSNENSPANAKYPMLNGYYVNVIIPS